MPLDSWKYEQNLFCERIICSISILSQKLEVLTKSQQNIYSVDIVLHYWCEKIVEFRYFQEEFEMRQCTVIGKNYF